MLIVVYTECRLYWVYADGHYAECTMLNVVILSVIVSWRRAFSYF